MLCHDNESCPLAARAHASLGQIAAKVGMRMEDVEYSECVDSAYRSDSVKMWMFTFD